jgi:hypothetical protein
MTAEVAQVRAWFPEVAVLAPKALTFVHLGGRWINSETGKRSDVPHNMIYPLRDTRPNLHFLTGVHVKHVTFNE